MRRWILFLVLSVSSSAFGQSIDGPDTVQAGVPVWYSVSGADESASVAFIPAEVLDTSPERIVTGSALFWSPAAGDYSISAMVIDWERKTFVPITKTIVVEGEDRPDPTPNPKPKPIPDDEVIPPGPRMVLIVSESSSRSHQEAATLAAVRRTLDSRNQTYRILDPDTTSDWLAPHLAELEKRKMSLPVMMVIALPTADHAGGYLAVESLSGHRETLARIEEVLGQ